MVTFVIETVYRYLIFMAISKSIVGCDANDLLQLFSLGQEATETSPFLHTLNSIADIISFVPENISPCKYYDSTLIRTSVDFCQR